jgi:aspartate racemase
LGKRALVVYAGPDAKGWMYPNDLKKGTAMKTLGIVGGIGPESTVDYYRSLMRIWQEQTKDGSAPSILLNSIDLKKWLNMLGANELSALTAYASEEMERLAMAGAHIGLFASNTPHIVFDDLQRRSSIPLISIVEATREAAEQLRLRRLGLFGIRFTMQGRFYPDVFSKAGITLVVPDQSDQGYIHDVYVNQLLKGVFLPETRERLLTIVHRLEKQERVEGVILAGTELPLILREASCSIPFLDTAEIHVKAALRRLLS